MYAERGCGNSVYCCCCYFVICQIVDVVAVCDKDVLYSIQLRYDAYSNTQFVLLFMHPLCLVVVVKLF